MRHHEFLSEDELFEINMSPSNLQKLAKDIPQAKFGLEFELIVPNTNANDGDEYENDYDYDERARSFRGIYDFFNGGDGNNSRRDVQNMINALQEHYHEWAGEKIFEQWVDNGFEYFSEYVDDDFDEEGAIETATEDIADSYPDLDQNSDEFAELLEEKVRELKTDWIQEQWDDQGNLYDAARESFDDGQDWPDEDDWLDNEGYRYMSDLESFGHDHDVYWPHQSRSNSGETDMSEVAESISDALGVEVKVGGYHNISRSDQVAEGFWILETDGSLQGNESDDAGLELVSPPLTLEAMRDAVKKVADWAESYGAYTGKLNKTGLHMNVSVPGYSKDKLDFVKLALLLGDNHILKEFDRVNYTYANSSFDLLASRMKGNPDLAKKAMTTMKGHFDMAASKALHSGTTDKYTSINVKDNRVEFRGPGGNYLKMFETNPNKLFAPMMRFAVALDAAIDPAKYRDEYQKKLYKFLSKSVPSKDLLELFTDYAAGKGFAQSAYKSFLKKRKSERDLERSLTRPGEGVRVGGRKSNPDGDWILFRQHRRDNDYVKPFDVEVLYRFNAVNQSDADVVRDQYVKEHNPSFQVLMGSDPEKKNGQPGYYKNPDHKDDGSKATWGVYRKSDGTQMKYRGEYVRFENSTRAQAESDLRDIFSTAHTSTAIDDYEVRKLMNYEIYTRDDGRWVTRENGEPLHFDASSFAEAEQKMPRIISDFNIGTGNPNDYAVRSVLTPPAHTTTTSGTRTEQRAWQIINQSTNLVAEEFLAPNRAHAVQKFQDFLLRAQQVGRNPNDYTLQLKGSDDGEDTSTNRQSYTVYDVDNRYNVTNFPADNEEEATRLFRQRVAGESGTFELRRSSGGEVVARSPEQTATATGAPQATPNDAAWEREQQSYRTGENWEVYNADDQNIVVRTLNNMGAEQVAATLPRLEDELNLPRGSLRVRVV